jgi:hypothetical protein
VTRRILTLTIAALLALGLFAGPLQAAPASSGLDADVLKELAQVRRATAKYHDVQTALADGYVADPHCVAYPPLGGMGFHYVRPYLLPPDHPASQPGLPSLDPLSPDILVYAPRPNGSLQLVAVEYASWDDEATLLGQAFAPAAPPGQGPPFATLHAWVWKANPSGVFAPFNPNVSC